MALGAGGDAGEEGVFISTRLLGDRFSLAFELFINVGHAFVDEAGVPESFSELAWNQAVADVRGETSLDAWESRAQAVGGGQTRSGTAAGSMRRPRRSYLEAAFSDAVAIYMLSLAVDFDYSELREREYPLLAPQALAERLRLVARLFPAECGVRVCDTVSAQGVRAIGPIMQKASGLKPHCISATVFRGLKPCSLRRTKHKQIPAAPLRNDKRNGRRIPPIAKSAMDGAPDTLQWRISRSFRGGRRAR